MSVDHRDVEVLPSGLFLQTEMDNGHVLAFITSVRDDDTPYGEHTRTVSGTLRWDGLAVETPPCLGADFRGGGWCDLMVCNAAEVEALGGFSAIERVSILRK